MAGSDIERQESLRRRLRRMGVVRGMRNLPPSPRRRVSIESLVEGAFYDTPRGRCFVAETSLPADHRHGDCRLGDFLSLPATTAAALAGDPALAKADLSQTLFLDTETTGLSGGTGTMAFLVGLGFFEGERFCLLQPFLRDPGDEPALLHLLDERLPRFQVLVTFNGRGFDVPILENRFILDRRRCPLIGLPHLDLLAPSRRLWRLRLSSCALGVLEREVLGVQRDQADVPSGVIPLLYRDYLRTGDARDMARVLYHNRVDILSMVTLATRLGRSLCAPREAVLEDGAELLALALWRRETGGEAEPALRAALAAGISAGLRRRALRELALLLKQGGRWAEAAEWWQQLALEEPHGVEAAVELAKIFEWHIPRLWLALGWTRVALTRAACWPAGLSRDRALADLRHRLERLEGKSPLFVCAQGAPCGSASLTDREAP